MSASKSHVWSIPVILLLVSAFVLIAHFACAQSIKTDPTKTNLPIILPNSYLCILHSKILDQEYHL
jgi:hypothetical protein